MGQPPKLSWKVVEVAAAPGLAWDWPLGLKLPLSRVVI